MQTSILATTEQLLERSFTSIRRKECCAEKFIKMARELESLKEKCNASQCVGTMCMTVFLFAATAHLLDLVGIWCLGVGATISVATPIIEQVMSFVTMTKKQDLEKQSNKTTGEIQEQFKQVREQVSVNKGPSHTTPNQRFFPPQLLLSLPGKRLSVNGTQQLIQKMIKIGLKTAAVTSVTAVGRAAGMAFDSLKDQIMENHVAAQSQSLRDTTNKILKSKREFEETTGSQRKHQKTFAECQREEDSDSEDEDSYDDYDEDEYGEDGYDEDDEGGYGEDEDDYDEDEYGEDEDEDGYGEDEDDEGGYGEDEDGEDEDDEGGYGEDEDGEDEDDEGGYGEDEDGEDEDDEGGYGEDEDGEDEDDEGGYGEDEDEDDEGGYGEDEDGEDEDDEGGYGEDEDDYDEDEYGEDEYDEGGYGEDEDGEDEDDEGGYGEDGYGEDEDDEGGYGEEEDGEDEENYSQDEEHDQEEEDGEEDTEDDESSVKNTRKHKFESRPKASTAVRVALLNVQSMNNKRREVLDIITQNNLDVLCTTETWLQRHTGRDVLRDASPHDFSFYHQVRPYRGGGVAVQFLNTLLHKRFHFNCKITRFEFVATVLKHNEWEEPVLIVNVYRPPGSNLIEFQEFLDQFKELLKQAESYKCVILTGDFNIWFDPETRSFTDEFLWLLPIYDFVQHVKVPTHEAGHILDLVFSRNVEISCLSVRDDRISDHYTVYFSVRPKPKETMAENTDKDEHGKRFRRSKK
ncbi:uncharacterized protein [Channa argus]|uniref:uncharacterized protein isoform X1 n=1 Tax=Channa argus TaxID=215402 RepID=UPI0035225B96